jgi:hypothetical protein
VVSFLQRALDRLEAGQQAVVEHFGARCRHHALPHAHEQPIIKDRP